VFTINYGYGYWRLQNNPTQYDKNFVIRIVNIKSEHADKWNAESAPEQLRKYKEMSQTPSSIGEPNLVIWPETAVIEDVNNEVWQNNFASFLKTNQALIVGYVRSSLFGQIYNSLGLVNNQGKLLDNYDKQHLFPFWEYQPMGDVEMSKTVGPSNLTAGESAKVIQVADKKFYPIICYEAGFSSSPFNELPRADFIAVISNDIWFVNSQTYTSASLKNFDYAGPAQHYQDAPIRAIEQGLPLYRAANGGVNVVIDSLGREIKLFTYKEGYIDEYLIKPLPKTLYAKFGDKLFLVLGSLVLLGLYIYQRRKK